MLAYATLIISTNALPLAGITNLYDLYNDTTGHRIILIGEEHGEICIQQIYKP